MEIKPGPHGGVWIMDGERVVVWVYSEEAAKTLLFRMDNKL